MRENPPLLRSTRAGGALGRRMVDSTDVRLCALRFALEWANRPLRTGVIGNDQTELQRVLIGVTVAGVCDDGDDEVTILSPRALAIRASGRRTGGGLTTSGPSPVLPERN